MTPAPGTEPGRTVTMVLCTAERVLGVLPSFAVDRPYWQEIDAVTAHGSALCGQPVTVLRLLSAARPTPPDGGPVTYLAQVDRPPSVPLRTWRGADPLAADPRRAPFAVPDGPDRLLSWAADTLAATGRPRTGPAEPMRTWNLSALWRLPTVTGPVWLKAVPPFLAHETAVLELLGPDIAPTLVAGVPGQLLVEDLPGTDQYDAGGPVLVEMVRLLVGHQQRWAGDTGPLEAAGVPDRRAGPASAAMTGIVARLADQLTTPVRQRLDRLIAGLPERWNRIADCGLPDTLVHGDFHPGNVRGRPGRWHILDWGDSVIGHPALDILRFSSAIPAADEAAVDAAWVQAWGAAVPGSDPERAAYLLAPLAPLLAAATYRRFLDLIEPDEWVYHVDDPLACLLAADRIAAAMPA